MKSSQHQLRFHVVSCKGENGEIILTLRLPESVRQFAATRGDGINFDGNVICEAHESLVRDAPPGPRAA